MCWVTDAKHEMLPSDISPKKKKKLNYKILQHEIVFIPFEYLKQIASFPVPLVTSVPLTFSPVHSVIIIFILP